MLDPPFNIVRASYVDLGVRDLAAARAFYVDCLGYLVSDESEDALHLRALEERNHHSVVLQRADEPTARALVGDTEEREHIHCRSGRQQLFNWRRFARRKQGGNNQT